MPSGLKRFQKADALHFIRFSYFHRLPLAQFLKALKQITSRKLRGDRPQFWQDRYFDTNIHGETARSKVIRYIHRNLVKRGLVASPEQYRWSSFNHYATGMP